LGFSTFLDLLLRGRGFFRLIIVTFWLLGNRFRAIFLRKLRGSLLWVGLLSWGRIINVLLVLVRKGLLDF
jgi:hypothetical protein